MQNSLYKLFATVSGIPLCIAHIWIRNFERIVNIRRTPGTYSPILSHPCGKASKVPEQLSWDPYIQQADMMFIQGKGMFISFAQVKEQPCIRTTPTGTSSCAWHLQLQQQIATSRVCFAFHISSRKPIMCIGYWANDSRVGK